LALSRAEKGWGKAGMPSDGRTTILKSRRSRLNRNGSKDAASFKIYPGMDFASIIPYLGEPQRSRIMVRKIWRLSVALCLCVSFIVVLNRQSVAAADTVTYQGDWHTTNRKLDGTMTCIVTPTGDERWQGRFFGVWQGVNFNYTVPFTGPPSNLHGNANIDGAEYYWTGKIVRESPGSFQGTFGGARYNGSFDLKETQ